MVGKRYRRKVECVVSMAAALLLPWTSSLIRAIVETFLSLEY